ncbi:family 16 glycosylhydrolase, partial [Xanthovirga aplysinae]|uniref:family 16 glycosylhydrolase n=1 Tax=Xanthovirga aplysinae TaxID=2529853 RepID=UPI0012BC6E51
MSLFNLKLKFLIKPLLGILIFCLVRTTAYSQCLELVWEDNFDSPTLDLSKWQYSLGRGCDTPAGCGWGNAEEQSYTDNPRNVSVSNGTLKITTIFESVEPGAAFSSGKITTEGISAFQYGKIEARIKLPSATGVWPAFWMLPVNNQWPTTGEIDIMEASHLNPTMTRGTVHHTGGFTTGTLSNLPDLSADFHTYSIEWEKDEIRWYFDDQLYHKATPTSTGGAWPFNDNGNPFYLILNSAVGGLGTPFTGNIPFEAEEFPTTMEVDYVRVYEGHWNTEFSGAERVYKGDVGNVYELIETQADQFNWSVPSGATITSGQGTNKITVDWGLSAQSGQVVCEVTQGCGITSYAKEVLVEEPFELLEILEDFENNRNINFAFANGTLSQAIDNPFGEGIVGKYIRNASELYDVLIYDQIAFGNASDYATGRKRLRMDIFTDAPVGSLIRIQLENSAVANNSGYPTGRHSIYEVLTTVQNQWQTLEFEYKSSPDPGTDLNSVDQLVFLFEPETNNENTYYFDNLLFGSAGPLCDKETDQILEDFDQNREIIFDFSTGTLSATNNPASDPINNSQQVGQYQRNAAELYDVLYFREVSIPDAGDFKNGKASFKMDVFTNNAPIGSLISIQLETTSATADNYPQGRHSLFQGSTSTQNQWETIEFNYISAPDALAEDAEIDKLVILFNPNSSDGSTYFFDNLATIREKCDSFTKPLVNITSPENNAIFNPDEIIQIAADASGNNPIAEVSFRVNGSQVGLDNQSPYSTEWSSSESGNYLIEAIAKDTEGVESLASAITIQIRDDDSGPVLTAIEVVPENSSVNVGESVQFQATGKDQNGDIMAITPQWTVNNGGNIDPNTGLFTASTEGQFTITATEDNISGSTQITVLEDNNPPNNCTGEGADTSGNGPDYFYELSSGDNPTLTFKPARQGVG